MISSPAKAWEEIRLQEDKRKVLIGFVYPMIGLCALAVFLGTLFTHGWGGPESFQLAMTRCCVVAVALFGGFYLAAYIINIVGEKMCGLPNDNVKAQQFAGYSLAVTFLTYIVTGFFPDLSFIALVVQLYIVYIVWEGVPVIMGITENFRLRYTLIVSSLLILCPWVIQFLFNKLLFILN